MSFTCKGCPDRTPKCHDKCEKYQKEKAEHEAMKERQNKQNAVKSGLNDQTFRAVSKAIRSHGRKVGQ